MLPIALRTEVSLSEAVQEMRVKAAEVLMKSPPVLLWRKGLWKDVHATCFR